MRFRARYFAPGALFALSVGCVGNPAVPSAAAHAALKLTFRPLSVAITDPTQM
jgi:hypothetical protein